MKQHTKFLMFVTVMGFTCSTVRAQKPSRANPCFNTANTQMALDVCAGKEAKQADLEMNRIYQKLLAKVSTNPAAKTKIIASQRAWLLYRDAYLDATFPEEDKQANYGTMFPMEFDLLVAQLTTTQTKALQQLLENYSDDNHAQ
jgi:uncharacterized protein YecT (DUF1311 family)